MNTMGFRLFNMLPRQVSPLEHKAHHPQYYKRLKRTRVVTPPPTVENSVEIDKPPSNKRVTFSTVSKRLYNPILGDNPHVAFPLSMGWTYNEQEEIPVEIYDCDFHELEPDYVYAQDMEPLEVEERRMRLKAVGYTEKQLQQEERRRRIQLVLEWARSPNRQEGLPCTVTNASIFLQRYILQ